MPRWGVYWSGVAPSNALREPAITQACGGARKPERRAQRDFRSSFNGQHHQSRSRTHQNENCWLWRERPCGGGLGSGKNGLVQSAGQSNNPTTNLQRRRIAGFAQPAPQPYLEETCVIPIRFHEVDSMGVVWHGHYAAYLEEARRALGRRYGVDYATFFAHSTPAPVAQLHVDYLAPARLADTLTVTARLFKSEAARLEFEYEIRRQSDGSLLAFGTSLQVFTNPEGELLLTLPPFMVERYRSWEALWTQP